MNNGVAMDPLADLRTFLKVHGLSGFILPRENRFRSAHLSPWEERLAWLTGFTGSAGLAIVLADRAALFVDGRYTLAASRQIASTFEITEEKPEQWLARALPISTPASVGFDPWQFTPTRLKCFQRASPHLAFKQIAENPVDVLWCNRPVPESPAVFPIDLHCTGCSTQQKHRQILQHVQQLGAQALFLADPASVAWVLNVRTEAPYFPIPSAYALLQETELTVFSNITYWPDVPHCVHHPLSGMQKVLDTAVADTLLLDLDETSCAVYTFLRNAKKQLITAPNPCKALKAIKNVVELEGFRDCHQRDAVALIEFLAWLEQTGPCGTIDEHSAAERLLEERARDPSFRGPSFETISASGPNAAFVHYRVPSTGARFLQSGEGYLLDSGGHYENGTTDCTRTIGLGPVADTHFKRIYTAVLKGLIAATTTIFPRGTPGAAIDSIARQPLWQMGYDYDHGTGHGVGHYLSVHEDPPTLSKLSRTPLELGMVLSIEPGCYKPDVFGIRLENVVEVVPASENPGFLTFSPLTLVPFEPALIEQDCLTREEAKWLHWYHSNIWKTLYSRLSKKGQEWLNTRKTSCRF